MVTLSWIAILVPLVIPMIWPTVWPKSQASSNMGFSLESPRLSLAPVPPVWSFSVNVIDAGRRMGFLNPATIWGDFRLRAALKTHAIPMGFCLVLPLAALLGASASQAQQAAPN